MSESALCRCGRCALSSQSPQCVSTTRERARKKGLLQKQCHSIRKSDFMSWDKKETQIEPNYLDVSTESMCSLSCIQGHKRAGVNIHISMCLHCLHCIEHASYHRAHESRIDLTKPGCFVPVNVFVHSSKSSTGNEQGDLIWIFPLARIEGKWTLT